MSNFAFRSEQIAFKGLNYTEYLCTKLKFMGIDRRYILLASDKLNKRKYSTLEEARKKIYSILLKEMVKDFEKHKGSIKEQIRTGIKDNLQNMDKGNIYRLGILSRMLANTIKEIKKQEGVKCINK